MTADNRGSSNDAGDLNQLEAQLREGISLRTASKAAAGSGTTPDAPIPEKYKDKSIEDVIRMHQEAQSALGRMSNDLGVQRKLTDRLLDLTRTDVRTATAPANVQIKTDDLLDNPAQAIKPLVDAAVAADRSALNDRLNALETNLAQDRFVARHPDYQERANDPDFVAWVSKTQYRQRAAAMAAQGSAEAADDLLTEYKELRRSTQADPSRESDLEAARRIGFEGGSPAARSSGKIYRRADLMRLKIEKPEIYQDPAFQDEIVQAYRENRVK